MKTKYKVHAKEWYDRTYGNSYCSVRVYDCNGNEIARGEMENGYGDFYLQKAKQLLNVTGIASELFSEYHCDRKCYKRDVVEWGKAAPFEETQH